MSFNPSRGHHSHLSQIWDPVEILEIDDSIQCKAIGESGKCCGRQLSSEDRAKMDAILYELSRLRPMAQNDKIKELLKALEKLCFCKRDHRKLEHDGPFNPGLANIWRNKIYTKFPRANAKKEPPMDVIVTALNDVPENEIENKKDAAAGILEIPHETEAPEAIQNGLRTKFQHCIVALFIFLVIGTIMYRARVIILRLS